MNIIVKGIIGDVKDVKQINNKDMLEFSLAFNESKKDATGQWQKYGETIWIKCSIWGDKANTTNIKKGDLVQVIGKLSFFTKETKTYVNCLVNLITDHQDTLQFNSDLKDLMLSFMETTSELNYKRPATTQTAYDKVLGYEPEPNSIRSERQTENKSFKNDLPF